MARANQAALSRPKTESRARGRAAGRRSARESRGEASANAQSQRPVNVQLNEDQVRELLCQALETEIGGVQIYETAIKCAQNEELRGEWEKYLAETRNHERLLRGVFEKMDLDTEMETPGRRVVRANAEAFVNAMELTLSEGAPEAAQICAAECVVLAETKDHFNWELIGEVCEMVEGEGGTALKKAFDEVEDQEDEHLYHTKGWARELWLDSFGLTAKLPPPEEKNDVRTQMGAARTQKQRNREVARETRKATRGRGGRKSR